jgi:hypothetical protein
MDKCQLLDILALFQINANGGKMEQSEEQAKTH